MTNIPSSSPKHTTLTHTRCNPSHTLHSLAALPQKPEAFNKKAGVPASKMASAVAHKDEHINNTLHVSYCDNTPRERAALVSQCTDVVPFRALLAVRQVSHDDVD